MLIGLPDHADGDALRTGNNVVAGCDVGDAPVGPGVAADDGEARAAVVELDARLDPLARGRGVGGVGDGQQDARLVVLLRVGCGEGDGCGSKGVDRAGGVRADGC